MLKVELVSYTPLRHLERGCFTNRVFSQAGAKQQSGSSALVLILSSLFLILFLSAPSISKAQIVAESDSVHPRLYYDRFAATSMNLAFDPTRDAFYIYTSPGNMLMRINKYSKPDTLIKSMPEDFRMLNLEVRTDGSGLYLWDTSGGRVFNYDIENDTLFRIDTSFEHRAFYHHAPALTADDRIWFMGGYGFFTYKNLLVYFDPNIQEWFEYEVKGFKPPYDISGYLVPVSEDNSFYYFEWRDRLEPKKGPQIYVYLFDIQNKEWTEISNFDIPDKFSAVLEQSRGKYSSTGTYKYDPVNRLLMLEDAMAYDPERDQMIFFDRSKYDDTFFGGANFYDRDDGHWYSLSIHPTDPPYLDAYAFTYTGFSDAVLVRIDPNIWYKSEWALYLGGLITAFFFGFTFYRLLKINEENQPGKNSKIRLRISDDFVDLTAKGNKVAVTDPSEKEMWRLINELLHNKQHAMSMSEADDRLFGSHVPVSQRSRNRKKLIDTVHKKTNCEFLSIKRDDVDKRFKVLTIDPKCFDTIGDA